jgi:replication-associated recombination protein RarA
MLNDDAWQALQVVQKGERSKLVNQAIIELARSLRRVAVAKKMDAARARMQAVTTKEIVSWVREDRNR